MSYLLHTLFCFHFGAVFEYHRHIFLALSYNFLHWTAPKGIVKFCDNAFLAFQDCDESAPLFIPCFIVRNCGADFIVLRFQSVIAFHQGIVVCFGLCPCQHNGTYTRNVYPATPTKKPVQILRFAESKNEPLSRKSSEKRLKMPWVKVQVHRICQSPFWHLFVTPLKMGAKKPGSR